MTNQNNIRIYKIAWDYLLSFDQITEEMIDAHLKEWQLRKPDNMRDLFRAMIMHAQNRRGMDKSIGDIDRLSNFLFEFDPYQVAGCYRNWNDIFDAIVESNYRPPGRMVKTNKFSHWVVYCKALLSCARFLADFENKQEFDRFVEGFYTNEYSRIALPLLLKEEIFGFGFALACDFLKETGYPEFIKPDTHINDIARHVGISNAETDIGIFRDMIKFCRSIDQIPYEVDKLFWLVGSGKFYRYGMKINSSKWDFIALCLDSENVS